MAYVTSKISYYEKNPSFNFGKGNIENPLLLAALLRHF